MYLGRAPNQQLFYNFPLCPKFEDVTFNSSKYLPLQFFTTKDEKHFMEQIKVGHDSKLSLI